MSFATSPTISDRSWHQQVLLVAAGVVVLAFLLEVRADERVGVRGISRWALPQVCASRAWFGVACPACGLTRAMVHLAHGDCAAALRAHRLAGLVAFTILLQFPYRAAWLSQGRPPLGVVIPRLYLFFLAAALIVNWLVGLVFASAPP